MATAPIPSIRRVLEYGITEIDNNKILMGIPNYAYDWKLPFIKGQSAAQTISNVEAIERAVQYGATILFDEVAQTPFFYYTDSEGVAHVVWFDDARSMEAKFRLINEYQLSGAGVWQIMNFFPQMWLVVNSLYNVQKIL
nr:glycosyl hydrolase family 18 protein [uncultured Anaerocolumna sp.]